MLGDVLVTGSPPAITGVDGVTIRQTAGSTITINAGANVTLFNIQADNSLVDGLHIVSVANGRDIIQISGDNTTVRNTEIDGFERRGVYVNGGDGAQLLNNLVHGGTDGQGREKGGIILRNSANSTIAGNVVVQNNMDGIQIRQSTNPFIDHNTSANNGGSGVEFYKNASLGVCMRNNNITDNTNSALNAVDNNPVFDETATCTTPLAAGPSYGNNRATNAGGDCGGLCGGCSCVPAGTFWEFGIAAAYISTTPGDAEFYCPAEASLIDAGDDLTLYDLNASEPGDFNTAADHCRFRDWSRPGARAKPNGGESVVWRQPNRYPDVHPGASAPLAHRGRGVSRACATCRVARSEQRLET